MKTAIISDIHSNLEAFDACYRHALAQGVDRFVCLGDCTGYGADPCAVTDLLRSLPGLVLVRGNHEDNLFAAANSGISSPILAAVNWTRGVLAPAQLDFYSGLPYLHRDGDATFAHASAAAPERWEYLTMPGQIEACMAAAGTALTFIGHVHVPRVFYRTSEGAIRELVPASGVPIPLSPRGQYVINVGSVGQPRDGNSAASYVVYDDVAWQIDFFRPIYDYFLAGDKIRAAGLDPFFADRLVWGR